MTVFYFIVCNETRVIPITYLLITFYFNKILTILCIIIHIYNLTGKNITYS